MFLQLPVFVFMCVCVCINNWEEKAKEYRRAHTLTLSLKHPTEPNKTNERATIRNKPD